MTAVLVHELGHHGTGGSRFDLVTQWLALPWRVASRFVLGLCYGMAGGRRQWRGLLVLVTLATVTVAVVQAIQQGSCPLRRCSSAWRCARWCARSRTRGDLSAR